MGAIAIRALYLRLSMSFNVLSDATIQGTKASADGNDKMHL